MYQFIMYCFTKIYEVVKSFKTLVAGWKHQLLIANPVLAKLAIVLVTPYQLRYVVFTV